MALSNSQYESIMRVYNRTQLQKKHELDARVDDCLLYTSDAADD